jgi:hypothetical protein
MTGMYPHHSGSISNIFGASLSLQFPNLFTELKKQGYRTALHGKCHFIPVPYPATRGDMTLEYEHFIAYYKLLGNLIPYVGGPVGFASIALMCLPSASWGKMIAGFVAMAIIMVVDANVINPKLLSDNVEVHPILVVAALIGGGAVGGIAGMLVAVPFAAFLKIQLDRWVEKREAEVAAGGASHEEPEL